MDARWDRVERRKADAWFREDQFIRVIHVREPGLPAQEAVRSSVDAPGSSAVDHTQPAQATVRGSRRAQEWAEDRDLRLQRVRASLQDALEHRDAVRDSATRRGPKKAR